jgi:hypothetical protein
MATAIPGDARGRTDQLVQARLAALQARYPGRFDADGLERLRQQLRRSVEAAAALRRVALSNADEPEPIFHAQPREG